MPDHTTPVTGPHRIHIRAIPTGAELDLTSFVQHVITETVERLTNDLYDDLCEIAEHHPADRESLLTERLVQRLVTEGTTTVPVYGPQVKALSYALVEVFAPKGLPSQREAGAA
jgi:hypothetical protein